MRSRCVRVPRIVTFTVGCLCGGVAVYLSDETNGTRRRRRAVRDVTRLAGRIGVRAVSGAFGVATEFKTVARDTFNDQRADHRGATPT